MFNSSFYRMLFGFATILAVSLSAVFVVGYYEVQKQEAAVMQPVSAYRAE